MVFFDPRTDILFITAVLVAVSQIIQKKFVNKAKIDENQKKMKKHQEKMKELAKKDDHESKREMERIEKEFMETANETMRESFRQTIISMPVFLGAFWFLQNDYGKAVIDLPVPLPWFGENWSIQFFSQTNWFGWYFVSYLVVTILLNALLKTAKRVMKK